MDEDWFYYVIEYSCKKNEYLAEKWIFLRNITRHQRAERAECTKIAAQMLTSPNVNHWKISILASKLAAAQGALECE